jgi:putative two-component system response regulator
MNHPNENTDCAAEWADPVTHAPLLIVDDIPVNLCVLGDILQHAGYQVMPAGSGRAALRQAAREPRPSLILLDITMPDLDGYQVLDELKRNPVTRDIPVMFVTALSDAENEEKGFRHGVVDYITKPIKPDVVLARIRNQLLARQALDWHRDQKMLLEAEVARRVEENELIQTASIRALAHLAETRDPETGNHILRTQSYVRLLATLLQDHPRFAATIDAAYIKMVALSAPLHDIGKVGIPDAILLKPDKLDPEEWAIMQTHTLKGSEAIEQAERDIEQPVEFLALAKEVAHWHHERWDGQGYPDGLAGEAIPVSARLMALADVFDALISKRAYKKAMPYEMAREIIAAQRGQHFDPDVTDVFLANFAEFAAIATQFRDGR